MVANAKVLWRCQSLFVWRTAGIVSRTEWQQCQRTPFQVLRQAQSCREVHEKTWIPRYPWEEQMHKNPAKAIENSSTPTEMVRLFEWFYHHKDDNRYLTFIWKAMADCSTGLKRIPAAIPADARIVHKTGTGFPSAEGVQDMNDAGIILMPDGNHVLIAVFTTHSPSEAVIADIARQLLAQWKDYDSEQCSTSLSLLATSAVCLLWLEALAVSMISPGYNVSHPSFSPL